MFYTTFAVHGTNLLKNGLLILVKSVENMLILVYKLVLLKCDLSMA
jgi:hypothetical protein